MANSQRSSDLLNVNGKKKILDDLIAPNGAEKSINDIPSMLASGEKKTFNVGPPSDILSRVQAFLPQLKSANEQLEKVDPSKLDIENVEEEDSQYIEMNLGLGVYEEKKPGQSDSEDEDSEDEKLIIPNTSKPVDKPVIQVIEQ